MLLPRVFIWWYAQGLEDFFKFFKLLFKSLIQVFSIKTLFLTLFSPWKRTIGERQRGIDGLKVWLADNLVARLAGFMVRSIMIIISILVIIGYVLVFILSLVTWLLFPLILVFAFINIFIGII